MDIDPQLVVDVCGSGAAGSWALSNLGMKVATGDYQAGFAIKHMLKDLRLVGEISDRQDLALPAIALAVENFQKVSQLDDGLGAEQGTQAMIRAYSSPL
jgi:3-hydroxyisobutyrate dehydrogenase